MRCRLLRCHASHLGLHRPRHVEGVNVVTWDDVSPPKSNGYVFDPSRILGIRFHVPTNASGSSRYDFTISNLTFLRQL